MVRLRIAAASLQNRRVVPKDIKNKTILGCSNPSSVHITSEWLDLLSYKNIYSSIFPAALFIMDNKRVAQVPNQETDRQTIQWNVKSLTRRPRYFSHHAIRNKPETGEHCTI